MNNPKYTPTRNLIVNTSCILAVLLALPTLSGAYSNDADYEAALKIAEKSVARSSRSSSSPSANALSVSFVRTLFGRPYRVGDSWDVASWSFDHTTARMTADPEHREMKGGKGGLFRYSVVSVNSGSRPEVVIQITQLEDLGQKKPDARVQHLTLHMNDSLLQTQKTYSILDRAGTLRKIRVSSHGIPSRITPLEHFPLDAPELVSAETKSITAEPELPEGLRALALQADFKPNYSTAKWFDQNDLFGRPIQAAWQTGDPWPAYYKTPNGVSILLRKGTP